MTSQTDNQPIESAPTRIILDTDLAMGAPGSDIDDGFALALAIGEPAIEVELVTTVDGNTDLTSATKLSLNLLEKLGRSDVPVVAGASGPLIEPNRPRASPPGLLEQYSHLEPAPGHAAAEIVRTIMASPGEITLVAIGPLTNVAVALNLEPRIASAVKNIVIMGGYFFSHTGSTEVPGEFNIWADPEAAHIVLASGAPLRFVGLDVTYQVLMNAAQATQLSERPGSFAQFAGQCGLGWIETLRTRYPNSTTHGSFHLHDPLAVAAVTHPELLTWERALVRVATDSIARGVTIAEVRHEGDGREANCEVARAVDVDAFLDYFLGTLGRI